MAISLANITLDCDDTGAVATFWSAVLGLPLDDAPPEVAPYFRQISTPDGSANW
ncbi:MAG: VOC family protein, partial [Acidimicrobiales bacterium]